VHTTAHKQGFHILEKATEADLIMMGSWWEMD
jgi:fructose-specific component phosphotransferase system IIB-like protein